MQQVSVCFFASSRVPHVSPCHPETQKKRQKYKMPVSKTATGTDIPVSSSSSLPTPMSRYTGVGALTMYSPRASRSTKSSSAEELKMSASISRLSGRIEGAAPFWRRAGACCGCCRWSGFWAVCEAKMLRRVVGGRRIARTGCGVRSRLRLTRC